MGWAIIVEYIYWKQRKGLNGLFADDVMTIMGMSGRSHMALDGPQLDII